MYMYILCTCTCMCVDRILVYECTCTLYMYDQLTVPFQQARVNGILFSLPEGMLALAQ